MGETFRLGRILGIKVGVNWSVLVIFLLIAAGLAGNVLPHDHPGRGGAVYWAVGLAAAVLFFCCLLAHEVSHAVVARRNGLKVEGITLWLLGGMARIDGEFPNPGAELRIAGIGPLVSLVCGALFTGVAAALHAAGASGLLVDASGWLGGINILIAVFNTIPAAPLDGGRLLRAYLWWRTGDRTRSALAAAAAGRGFGWLLVIGGSLLALRTGDLGWLWFALIGWFLVAASTVEGQQAQVRNLLSGLSARQIMTPDPVVASASLTVARFLDSGLFALRHSAFPLTAGEAMPIGLVTLERIRQVPPAAREDVRLRDIMYPLDKVATARPEDSAADLVVRLNASPAKRVLVISDGRLVGVISPSDVARALEWMALNRH